VLIHICSKNVNADLIVELCLGPFIPSNAARGGGVMQPIVLSLAHALNSTPTYRPRIGAYLILCAAHANLISASVYLTGSAPNPIAHAKAASILGVDLNFSTWLKGGIVPGLLSLLLVPALLYVVIRPQKDANDIEICQEPVNDAHRPLVSMPASRNATANVVITQQADGQKPMDMREWMLVGILSLCLVLWVTQSYTGITASLVAFMGMVLVLAMGVLEWEDVLRNGKAVSVSIEMIDIQLTIRDVSGIVYSGLVDSLHWHNNLHY
jgi:DASS family divalent anion:Na+ symporter